MTQDNNTKTDAREAQYTSVRKQIRDHYGFPEPETQRSDVETTTSYCKACGEGVECERNEVEGTVTRLAHIFIEHRETKPVDHAGFSSEPVNTES